MTSYVKYALIIKQTADMAELADAPDLESGAERRMGSIPFIRTIFFATKKTSEFFSEVVIFFTEKILFIRESYQIIFRRKIFKIFRFKVAKRRQIFFRHKFGKICACA